MWAVKRKQTFHVKKDQYWNTGMKNLKQIRPCSDAKLFMSRTYLNLDRPKLTKVRLLIQSSNLIR